MAIHKIWNQTEIYSGSKTAMVNYFSWWSYQYDFSNQNKISECHGTNIYFDAVLDITDKNTFLIERLLSIGGFPSDIGY